MSVMSSQTLPRISGIGVLVASSMLSHERRNCPVAPIVLNGAPNAFSAEAVVRKLPGPMRSSGHVPSSSTGASSTSALSMVRLSFPKNSSGESCQQKRPARNGTTLPSIMVVSPGVAHPFQMLPSGSPSATLPDV